MELMYCIKNESLDELARKFAIDKRAILEKNKTTEENIKYSKILVLDIPSGKPYVVRPKENLISIAQKFHTTADILREFNDISEVFTGELIRIPD